jgi:hypothetical protein
MLTCLFLTGRESGPDTAEDRFLGMCYFIAASIEGTNANACHHQWSRAIQQTAISIENKEAFAHLPVFSDPHCRIDFSA